VIELKYYSIGIKQSIAHSLQFKPNLSSVDVLTKVTTANVNPCRMLDIHAHFVDSNVTSLFKTVACGIISSVARISQKGSDRWCKILDLGKFQAPTLNSRKYSFMQHFL